MINLLLLNNFYPVISYRRVREKKRRINGLVARYGPQSVASASGEMFDFNIILINFGFYCST